jgi:hypothetical protein
MPYLIRQVIEAFGGLFTEYAPEPEEPDSESEPTPEKECDWTEF